jgi:ribulose-5-phosphate 4-epimerase/fuculose-1-phosphate aldolase
VSSDGVATRVAWACRILAAHGYEDLTLGHVSAREDDDPAVMWIKRKGVSLAEVTPADVLRTPIDGDIEKASGMHLEAVLHTEVYRARSDVHCVVHGHPLHATALGAAHADLAFLSHDAILFQEGLAALDEVPELITGRRQGQVVADALGERNALLMRNHGVLVVGRDPQWAVLRAVTLERAVQVQATAGRLGEPRAVANEAVAPLHEMKYQSSFLAEYWDAWIRELRRDGRDFDMPGPGQ